MTEAKKANSASEDAKAKFKAALDAKNAKARETSSGNEGDGGSTNTKGPESAGPTQRMFRRKAGG
jgi:hypothetical protein